MIKVIEHGYKAYKTRCRTCSCYFEYELEDIKNDNVKCPDCGDTCPHNYYNKKFTSQIEDDAEIEE